MQLHYKNCFYRSCQHLVITEQHSIQIAADFQIIIEDALILNINFEFQNEVKHRLFKLLVKGALILNNYNLIFQTSLNIVVKTLYFNGNS